MYTHKHTAQFILYSIIYHDYTLIYPRLPGRPVFFIYHDGMSAPATPQGKLDQRTVSKSSVRSRGQMVLGKHQSCGMNSTQSM